MKIFTLLAAVILLIGAGCSGQNIEDNSALITDEVRRNDSDLEMTEFYTSMHYSESDSTVLVFLHPTSWEIKSTQMVDYTKDKQFEVESFGGPVVPRGKAFRIFALDGRTQAAIDLASEDFNLHPELKKFYQGEYEISRICSEKKSPKGTLFLGCGSGESGQILYLKESGVAGDDISALINLNDHGYSGLRISLISQIGDDTSAQDDEALLSILKKVAATVKFE